MNTTLSIPQVPEIITDRYYSIQAVAAVGANRIQLDRKLENSFEVVTILGNVYLITGTVSRNTIGTTLYEIYPSLLKPVALNDRVSCIQYNTDKNRSVLSTAQNFDIYSKFFKLITDFKALSDKLGSANLQLPLNNYQLAIKNGFSGTEADWLESLKGEDAISIDPNLYVLTTTFETNINVINQRLIALESQLPSQSNPTTGTILAAAQPLVINWNTDLVPNDTSGKTYFEKHGKLTGTTISVLKPDPANPTKLIEYPNSWYIDSATSNILTIDNGDQDTYYTIGFGANGEGSGGTPSGNVIHRSFNISSSDIVDGELSLIGRLNEQGDSTIPDKPTCTIYEGNFQSTARYNWKTKKIDLLSGSDDVMIMLVGILPFQLGITNTAGIPLNYIINGGSLSTLAIGAFLPVNIGDNVMLQLTEPTPEFSLTLVNQYDTLVNTDGGFVIQTTSHTWLIPDGTTFLQLVGVL